MKHPVIALKIHPGEVKFGDTKVKIQLPDGCIGVCFAFRSKKKAREWCGKDVDMVRIEKLEWEKDGV